MAPSPPPNAAALLYAHAPARAQFIGWTRRALKRWPGARAQLYMLKLLRWWTGAVTFLLMVFGVLNLFMSGMQPYLVLVSAALIAIQLMRASLHHAMFTRAVSRLILRWPLRMARAAQRSALVTDQAERIIAAYRLGDVMLGWSLMLQRPFGWLGKLGGTGTPRITSPFILFMHYARGPSMWLKLGALILCGSTVLSLIAAATKAPTEAMFLFTFCAGWPMGILYTGIALAVGLREYQLVSRVVLPQRLPPTCHSCGYDLRGTVEITERNRTTKQCPECGRRFTIITSAPANLDQCDPDSEA